MILQFLTIDTPSTKGDYLQHITELIQIKLEIGDTYQILFDKLNDWAKSEPENRAQAVSDFISFNLENPDMKSQLHQSINDFEGMYAQFNLGK